MLKKIALALVVVIVGILVFAATKPDVFHVERSAVINAPSEQIYPLLSDFHQWNRWSPWEELDPGMTRTHSGAPSGPGAVYEWSGNSDVGKGRMEITEAVEPSRVAIALRFIEPWEANNVATFRLAPRGNATMVTWTMDGPSPYLMKVMGVFMNMDRMIGTDFEKGLGKLKTVAEGG
jgi:uncharacterized protein YndB with AHSA1/START domain